MDKIIYWIPQSSPAVPVEQTYFVFFVFFFQGEL